MSIYKFTDPDSGKTFEVEGPADLTEAQAQAIFDQQQSSGSLVGLKSGDLLSAAKQAAGGLASAASQVAQGVAGIAGSVTGALGGAYNKVTSSSPTLSTALTGTASVASTALKTITLAVRSTPVTNGIGVSNYAKQSTAMVPFGGLSVVEITGTLAQASKLVGQSSSTITNTAGVGKYGLNSSQLETVGYVKPGTTAKYLASGTNNTTSVLNSPTVWTGKDNIQNLNNFLVSTPAQDRAQQTLMSGGLTNVTQLGVPVNQLSPQAVAGTALNAAKSVTDTVAWATGGALPSATKTSFDQTARDGAFSVDFSNLKIDDAMKQLGISIPGVDTVNRDTLDAASNRIVGNKKIPKVNYTDSPEGTTLDKLETAFSIRNAEKLAQDDIGITILKKPKSTSISEAVDDIKVLEQVVADLTEIDSRILGNIREADALPNDEGAGVKAKFEALQQLVQSAIKNFRSGIQALEQEIAALQK
jgi:hypothetical protein